MSLYRGGTLTNLQDPGRPKLSVVWAGQAACAFATLLTELSSEVTVCTWRLGE